MTESLSPLAKLVQQAWPVSVWRDFSVVVAVSGGADSIAMLRVLAELAAFGEGRGKLVVGHVDHGLRGIESSLDAQFVNQVSDSLGLQCHIVTLPADENPGSQKGRGLEANLRAARYAALQQMAETQGARYLVTAHNRNDQVETILFRMMRGTGITGLAGIPKQRVVSEHLTIVRPVLDVTRQDLLDYLQAINQQWREDASNQSTKFTRNRLRHEVLPLLDDVFENNVGDSLHLLGELANEHVAFLDRMVEPLLTKCFEVADHKMQVDLVAASQFDRYLLTIGLRRAWRQAGFDTKDMTASKWSALTKLCSSSEPPTAHNFPGDLRVQRIDGPARLVVAKQQ